jgi:NAD(P)-dependent dehydrogenase (short-subunit alcohol dehydrogenase family)
MPAGVELGGSRVIVTGGTSGIGPETARVLAGASAKLPASATRLGSAARLASAGRWVPTIWVRPAPRDRVGPCGGSLFDLLHAVRCG